MRNYKLITFLSVIIILTSIKPIYAGDCRGCCAGHGGIVCVNGVTRCLDETPLSQNCINKGCDICEEQPSSPTPTGNSIKIANFNIQVFGRTKSNKVEVMEILAETIARFDIVAIEEIRDSTGTAIKNLENAVDNLGTDYSYIIGPRLGRTTSKEQYAYFYKTSAVSVEDSYTYNDSADVFHREPFIAKFKALNGKFDFILIAIHTDPDDATKEIHALSSTVSDAKQHFSGEQDLIILGDLNADCTYFNEDDTGYDLRNSEYTWLIGNDIDTNVAGDCTYDRIIITSSLNQDYANVAEVFRFDQAFEMDCDTDEVSDHYPVFAEFYIDKDTD